MAINRPGTLALVANRAEDSVTVLAIDGNDNPRNPAIACNHRSKLAEIVDGTGRDGEIERIADWPIHDGSRKSHCA